MNQDATQIQTYDKQWKSAGIIISENIYEHFEAA